MVSRLYLESASKPSACTCCVEVLLRRNMEVRLPSVSDLTACVNNSRTLFLKISSCGIVERLSDWYGIVFQRTSNCKQRSLYALDLVEHHVLVAPVNVDGCAKLV